MQFLRSSWKAIVALAVPILMGAAAQLVTAVGDWVNQQGFTWGGVVVGVLSAVAVWLKANRPPA